MGTNNFLFKPTGIIAAGGSAREVGRFFARQRRERLAARVVAELGLIQTYVDHLTPQDYFDSSRWEPTEIRAPFDNSTPIVITPSPGFAPLTSPSGVALIDQKDTEPFRHLAAWPCLPDIREKLSDSEAQGNRSYGLANALVETETIISKLRFLLGRLAEARWSEAWGELSALGLQPDSGRRLHVIASTAGGQGAGAVIFILLLLARLIEDDRQGFEIFLHLLLPGFHGENQMEVSDKMLTTLSVLHDLAVISSLEQFSLELPDGEFKLKARHLRELYTHLELYQPRPARLDTYNSFVVRVADTIADQEFSGVSVDVRTQRSNTREISLAA